MSDQPPLTPSVEASKTFVIPTRPSASSAKGQKVLSQPMPTVDHKNEERREPERSNSVQQHTQAPAELSEEELATEAQQDRALEYALMSTQVLGSSPIPAQKEPLTPHSHARSSLQASITGEQTVILPEPRQSGPSSAQTPPVRKATGPHERASSRLAQAAVVPQEVHRTEAEEAVHTASTFLLPVVQPLQAPQPPLAVASQKRAESFQYANPLPPYSPPPPAQISRSRLWRVLPVALVIAALMVVLGGLLGQQLLSQFNTSNTQNSALVYSGDGPYVQFPLTDKQINALQHLAGHMKYKALASLYVSRMSLDDEIGQLIMVEYNQPSYSSDIDYMINTLHVGGVIMYEFQMTSASQTKSDIAHMQQRANIPLLISTDEEGGPYVHRLSNIYGYRMSATQIEQSGSLDVAKQQGLKTSRDLAALGINEDLAPDVDVNQVNGYDMVTRTFGNTPDEVVKYAGAYLQSMQGNGTIACIKHFPGLGGALTDAHKGLPVVNSTKQQIYNIDLAPFKAFIQSPDALLNPGMIMPTDVLLPAIDPKYPAELSSTFMTDILRKEFGYDGVSLTDALYMQGITNTWDMYTASVMALQAGNDMLLGANGTSQTIGVINAIKQALQNGQLTKARIDESVTRIIALKMQYHLMPTYIPEA